MQVLANIKVLLSSGHLMPWLETFVCVCSTIYIFNQIFCPFVSDIRRFSQIFIFSHCVTLLYADERKQCLLMRCFCVGSFLVMPLRTSIHYPRNLLRLSIFCSWICYFLNSRIARIKLWQDFYILYVNSTFLQVHLLSRFSLKIDHSQIDSLFSPRQLCS